MCVHLTEGKEWLRCLSVISAFLDDMRGQLGLSQIRGLAEQVPALAMCMQVEPSLPGHPCSTASLMPHHSRPRLGVLCLSSLWGGPFWTPQHQLLCLSGQFSVTAMSVCLPNSASQIQRSQAWAALPLLPAPRKERVPGPLLAPLV